MSRDRGYYRCRNRWGWQVVWYSTDRGGWLFPGIDKAYPDSNWDEIGGPVDPQPREACSSPADSKGFQMWAVVPACLTDSQIPDFVFPDDLRVDKGEAEQKIKKCLNPERWKVALVKVEISAEKATN